MQNAGRHSIHCENTRPEEVIPQERLQKILAHAGVASRRKAEEMISQGRVSINGHTVSEAGTKADPAEDIIKVDGKKIHLPSRFIYIVLYKPKNVMSTSSDPEGRPTVLEYVKERVKERVYPVGRLDFASEGLIILTNDGEFTELMTKAGVIDKVYHVKVAGHPNEGALERLRRGIFYDKERLAPCEITPLKSGDNPWFSVTLHQGRNQQIRNMFYSIGHPVEKLKRVRIGFLHDAKLKAGDWRFMRDSEVEQFKHEFEKIERRKTAKPSKAKKAAGPTGPARPARPSKPSRPVKSGGSRRG